MEEKTEQSEQVDSSEGKRDLSVTPQPTDKPKRSLSGFLKHRWWLVALVIVLVGAGVLAWIWSRESDQEPKEQQVEERAGVKDEDISKLYYAYKEGKTTYIRSIDLGSGGKADLLSFEETREVSPDEGRYWWSVPPSVDIDKSFTKLVYSENSNIKTYSLEDQTASELITSSPDTSGSFQGESLRVTPSFTSQGPGMFVLSSPKWSNDSMKVLFNVHHYEGGSIELFDTESSNYIELADTFRYVGGPVLEGAFTPSPNNAVLSQNGLAPTYLFNQWGTPLLFAKYDQKFEKVYGLLCPENLPASGDSQFNVSQLDAETLKRFEGERDCGEQAKSSLISVSVHGGQFTEKTKVDLASFAIYNDTIYIGTDSKRVEVFSVNSPAEKTEVKIAEIVGVNEGEISSIRFDDVHRPFAKVYTAGKVHIVDMITSERVATLDVSEVSALLVLGAQ